MPEWIVSWGGFWIGLIGTVIGVIGLIDAYRTRKHPPQAQLLTGVSITPIGIPNDPKIQVKYDDDLLDAPKLVVVTAEHIAGEDIDRFQKGDIEYRRNEESTGYIKGLLGDGDQHATLDRANSTISINPRIFQTGERVQLAAIANGDLELTGMVRMAGVRQVSSPDSNLSVRERTFFRRWTRIVRAVLILLLIGTVIAYFAGIPELIPVANLFALLLVTIYIVRTYEVQRKRWRRD